MSEIYSPPRVTRAARMLQTLRITPGFAFDIAVDDEDGEPWGFTREVKQNKAIERVVGTEPDLVVGRPACTDSSPWQRLNRAVSMHPEKYDEAKKEAVKHLQFVCKVYKMQYHDGKAVLA